MPTPREVLHAAIACGQVRLQWYAKPNGVGATEWSLAIADRGHPLPRVVIPSGITTAHGNPLPEIVRIRSARLIGLVLASLGCEVELPEGVILGKADVAEGAQLYGSEPGAANADNGVLPDTIREPRGGTFGLQTGPEWTGMGEAGYLSENTESS